MIQRVQPISNPLGFLSAKERDRTMMYELFFLLLSLLFLLLFFVVVVAATGGFVWDVAGRLTHRRLSLRKW